MLHTLGKTLVVATLSLVSAAAIIHLAEKNNTSQEIISSTALSRAGIKDLDVEYVDGKIYLNVELTTPKTCLQLIDSLGIHSIVIKTRTYQPVCSKISDTLMRVTYTQSIST
jgi:hypothetical protein